MLGAIVRAFVLAGLLGSPIAMALERIDVVVKPDYSTRLAGKFSDSLYQLIDSNNLFVLVARSSGFHLEFEIANVRQVENHEPELVSLTVISTLYKKKYLGVENESLLIDRGKAMCNKRLFKVCEQGMQARIDYALLVAKQNAGN